MKKTTIYIALTLAVSCNVKQTKHKKYIEQLKDTITKNIIFDGKELIIKSYNIYDTLNATEHLKNKYEYQKESNRKIEYDNKSRIDSYKRLSKISNGVNKEKFKNFITYSEHVLEVNKNKTENLRKALKINNYDKLISLNYTYVSFLNDTVQMQKFIFLKDSFNIENSLKYRINTNLSIGIN